MTELPDSEGRPSYIYCPSCKQFATETEGGQIIWKPYYKMTSEEQNQMDEAQRSFTMGNAKLMPSPEKCPTCQKKDEK